MEDLVLFREDYKGREQGVGNREQKSGWVK
jgi:hypothetical protein